MPEKEVIKDAEAQKPDTPELENEPINAKEPETPEINDVPIAEEARINYAELAENDARILREKFPELMWLRNVTELENPLRYAALRDLGLTPEEAYLATSAKRRSDNRAHLHGSVPKRSAPPSSNISEKELIEARELFPGASDAEIRKLYKKVTV